MKDKINKIVEDYGQLHQDACQLNDEGGDEGCSCDMRFLVRDIVNTAVDFLSYDMGFKDEEQRKVAVDLYLEDFKIK